MNSPLLLAAVAFFAVIIVGTALVAVNDWLESIATADAASGSGNQRRHRSTAVRPVGRAGLATGRARDSAEVFANAIRAGNVVTRSAATRDPGRKAGSLGWRT